MPCQPCPERSEPKENKSAGTQPSFIPDQELRRIWNAMVDLNSARRNFRDHLQFVSCQRCKNIAEQLLKLLDAYGRLLTNAENYRYEKGKMMPELQKLAEKLGIKLEEEKSGESKP